MTILGKGLIKSWKNVEWSSPPFSFRRRILRRWSQNSWLTIEPAERQRSVGESFRKSASSSNVYSCPACSTPNLNANRSRDDEPANLQRPRRRILLSNLDLVRLDSNRELISSFLIKFYRTGEELSRVDFSFPFFFFWGGNRWNSNPKRRFLFSIPVFASKSFVRFSLIFVNLCASKTWRFRSPR